MMPQNAFHFLLNSERDASDVAFDHKQIITSISWRRWTRATRCLTCIVLQAYTNVDAQCNKLVKIVGRTSSQKNVNLVRPTMVHFFALSIHLCRAKLTTRCDDRRTCHKSRLCLGQSRSRKYATLLKTVQDRSKEAFIPHQKLPSVCFARTPSCDGYRHT